MEEGRQEREGGREGERERLQNDIRFNVIIV